MKLLEIQQKLKAPKNQKNTFGGYKYRSCEDILEAVKPLLKEATLTITDKIVCIGNRFYVKATATFKSKEEEVSVDSYAREAETKKGMDDSQITGAASSYARKYALNGLFLIDDTKDADSTNNHGKGEKPAVKNPEIDDSLEKAPACDVCGSIGMKAKTKQGRVFWTCPEWKKHQDDGVKFKMVQPKEERTGKLKEFEDSLDKIK